MNNENNKDLLLVKKQEIRNSSNAVDYSLVRELPLLMACELKEVKKRLFIAVKILNDKLNIKNKMNEDQQMLFVDELIDETKGRDWRLAELELWLVECGRGKYGKIYERLDGALLFEFLIVWAEKRNKDINHFIGESYKKERAEAEQKRLAEQQNHTPEQIAEADRQWKEAIEKMKNKINVQKKIDDEKYIENKHATSLKQLQELGERTKNYIESEKERQWKAELKAWDGTVIDS